jgi:endo-1,4-beta-xylanase
MKHSEKSRGTFTYTNGEAIVAFAEANGQKVRGHTLGKPTFPNP